MTKEESKLINECRVMIVGSGAFIIYVKEELGKLGFGTTVAIAESDEIHDHHESGILVEYTGAGHSRSCDVNDIPVIYTFDFIEGAGAIVLYPEDRRDFLNKQNPRAWAAEYMSGYCAFWYVDGCDWLHDALTAIKEDRTSVAAMKTTAYMCARIAANIAVGRNVKRYPRFYLCRNLE